MTCSRWLHGWRLALAVIVAGCGPAVPTQIEARAAFTERRPALERMEDMVFKAATGAKQLDDVTLRGIADAGGALGLRIAGRGHAPPCIGGGALENVAPADGIHEGRYRVGWGLYQTAWEHDGVTHGDGTYHPGIVVTWMLGKGGPVDNEATACFLLDGTPRPP